MFTTTLLFSIFLSTILHFINGDHHLNEKDKNKLINSVKQETQGKIVAKLNEEEIVKLIQSENSEARDETVVQLKQDIGCRGIGYCHTHG